MQYHDDTIDKEWFLNLLNSKNYTITNTSEPLTASATSTFCSWDIEATNQYGTTYTFELKNRTDYDSHQYSDNICEPIKLERSKDLSHSFLVSLFKDCYVVHRLDEPHTIDTMRCQHTNNWDRTKWIKKIVHYTTDDKHRYQYT